MPPPDTATGAPVRIAMWSGPRNISTAMMRAFENRADAIVWDEPLYAYYLRATGLAHPLAAEIIAAYDGDWRRVMRRCATGDTDGAGVFYQKHMTHHVLPEMQETGGLDWLEGLTHAFLIRDPARVVASYAKKRAEVTLEDLGFPQQLRLFEAICDRDGTPPPVVDSDDLLADPEGLLRALCAALGVPFDPDMLHWPAGRRDSDGLWASHWYGAVEASTGFAPPTPASPVPEDLRHLVEAAEPFCAALRTHRLSPLQSETDVMETGA